MYGKKYDFILNAFENSAALSFSSRLVHCHRHWTSHDSRHHLPARFSWQEMLQRHQQTYRVGQGAVDFVLKCRIDNSICDILRLKHWKKTRLDAVKHARVDVVRTHQRHADVLVSMRPQLGEETLVKANAAER